MQSRFKNYSKRQFAKFRRLLWKVLQILMGILTVVYLPVKIYCFIKRTLNLIRNIFQHILSKIMPSYFNLEQEQNHAQANQLLLKQTQNQQHKSIEATKSQLTLQQQAQLQPKTLSSEHQNNANRGLRNLGNTCYMNCILQCLHKSRYFNQSFQKELKKRGQIWLQQNAKTLVSQYNKLSKQLWLQSQAYGPSQIKKIVATKNFLFQYNQQNDASEFLSTFLSIIGQQFDNSQITKQNDKNQRHSIIQETFTGRYRTSYICQQCKDNYVIFEKFNIHYVKIPTITEQQRQTQNYKEYDLNECLQQFRKPELLRGEDRMTCDKCKVETDTDKTMSICKTNKILVVAIQRFINGRKDKRRVNIPKQITQLNKTYKLYATCLHFGGLNSGHYTAVCLNYKTNKWVDFNDSRCRQVDDIELDNAYVLFYQQCDSSINVKRGSKRE